MRRNSRFTESGDRPLPGPMLMSQVPKKGMALSCSRMHTAASEPARRASRTTKLLPGREQR
ncbi:BQ5605_C049g12449 [Microbotryum silenes-dioicae]|uniref:BQ5605_C049g12449 protein n=1 Tax=Microbotryum silenes-dioicae TaxID=796604 RepID=A0A2X0PPI4_9BASI|nr:BQ5605_C049g12449 [Microbotryum silenes-dioicae]